MLKVWEKAPAKINLTLDVLGKRSDGYHEVEMVMTMVDLADHILLEDIEDNKIILETNSAIVPNNEDNLIYKACQFIKKELGINKGVKIYLRKKIPIAAGLAGGSSDAAATLRGLNRLWNLKLNETQLMEYGGKLGSDVPFCVIGGTALAKGRGEIIERITSVPVGWVILAKPSISVSTQDVYNNLKFEEIREHPRTNDMIEAITNQDFYSITNLLHNVLESTTFKLYPQVEHLYNQMRQYGADGTLMSGSGPTIFTLVNKEARIKRIYNGLRGFCKEVYVVRLLK